MEAITLYRVKLKGDNSKLETARKKTQCWYTYKQISGPISMDKIVAHPQNRIVLHNGQNQNVYHTVTM